MGQKLSKFLLCKMAGWKTNLKIDFPDKCIFCVAPHTSNWDFIVGKLLYSAIGGKDKVSFLIKKDWFRFPFNLFFNRIGGVPVDRSKKNSLVEQMVEKFKTSERFTLAITPEATRKANPNWKKGFYYMALEANVPIVLVYMDYKKKEAGAERIFYPTGDVEKDMQEIKAYYSQFSGKFPNQFQV